MIGFGIGVTMKAGEGAPKAIDPASLFANGEQGIWLDPSDATTMFTDTGGTAPASVGNAIARINDKSGLGYHATQSSSGARPTLAADGSLDFDGTADFMTSGSIDFAASLSQKITVCVAFDGTGQSGTGVLYEAGRAGTNPSGSSVYFRDDGTGYEGRWWNNTESQGVRKQHAITPTKSVLTVLMDRDQADIANAMKLRLNGAEVATTTLQSNISTSQSFRNYPLSIGRYYNIAAGYFSGKLYGMVIVNRILTPAQISGLERFLIEKSGL